MELLERETHLHVLEDTVKIAAAGRGRTVFVCGEAGIGKTSMVEAFTARLDHRARVLWGACEALFTPRPLGPFYDVVHALGGPLRAQLEAGIPHIDLFHSLLESIRRHERPTVIVLEDMHWADHATLDFMRFVARRIAKLPALLICTYRDDEVGADHPLVGVLGDIPSADQLSVRLPLLSRATVERLARASGRAGAELYRITGGNPFFVNELLTSDSDGLAPSVRQAVLARAQHLSGSARELIELISVVPDKLELEVIGRILPDYEQALEECITRGLLGASYEYVSFRHEIARLAIESTLSPVRRTRLNRFMLDALADLSVDSAALTRLAHHALAARNAEAIVRYAPQAARAASERGAHREAATLLGGTFRFIDRLSAAERAVFHEQRARVCFTIDESSAAVQASEAAFALWQTLGDAFAQGRNLVQRCEYVFDVDLFSRSRLLAIANEAVEVLDALAPSAELAHALVWQGIFVSSRSPEQARICLDRALAIAEALDQPGPQIEVLNRATHLENALFGAPRDETIERLFEIARANNLDRGILAGWRCVAQSTLRRRDLAKLEHAIEEGLRFAADRQLDRFIPAYILMVHQVELDHVRGRWAEADAGFARLRDSGRPGLGRDSVAMLMMQYRAIPMLARAGREEAGQWLDDALKAEPDLHPAEAYLLHRARVEYHWLRDELDTARHAAIDLDRVTRVTRHPWMRGEALLWRWATGISETSQEEIAQPYALMIRGDWYSAAKAWEQLDCPYDQGFALQFGDEQAKRHALRIFDELGANAAAEHLRGRMREQGVKGIPMGPRATTRAHAAGLTNREHEILELLAQGLSNADIAGRLHRSIRTVENHVAAVTSKLGADSRAGAVARARNRGLLGG